MTNEKAIIGCILGTAVGDALGLPYEGLSPTRARKLLGPPDRHRFILRRGMISDDTEHTYNRCDWRGIVGARVGKEGIPAEWIGGIWEWPRSVAWMQSLGMELSQAWPNSSRAPRVNPIAVIMRNVLFLAVVLSHGFRRIGPPYS